LKLIITTRMWHRRHISIIHQSHNLDPEESITLSWLRR
jgi:hypothetical protein